MPSLAELQAWFLTGVTHRAGTARGLEAAREFLSPLDRGRALPTLVRGDDAWPAEARLEVYWNAYFLRLQECLRNEFPALRKTVGDEAFDAFASDYLERHPPESYTLNRLGERFADFLASTRPARSPGGRDAGPDWADFLVDLASFEWTLGEVFDGPGSEGSIDSAIAPASVGSDACVEAVCLELSPSLRLVEHRFPVHAFHAAVMADEPASFPPPRRSFVALSRVNFQVKRHSLCFEEFTLLQAVQRGASLGAALDALCESSPESIETVEANVSRWFAEWTQAGFIRRVIPPTE